MPRVMIRSLLSFSVYRVRFTESPSSSPLFFPFGTESAGTGPGAALFQFRAWTNLANGSGQKQDFAPGLSNDIEHS